MACPTNKIDSNTVGLSIAEEECIKVLPDAVPDSGLQDGGVWYVQEPNSYSDFGGTVSTTARKPIDAARQNKKGTVTTIDANGGFNVDVTRNNQLRLMQGFMFADAREKVKTQPLNGSKIALTSVTASTKQYNAASGLAIFNKAGSLIFAEGFGTLSNNGLKSVVSAASGNVVINETLVDEASPPASARLTTVGFQFPSADVSIAVTAGIPSLVGSATNLTTLGLTIGEYIYIGGDITANKFANNAGYARIASISTTAITFDDTTFTPVTEAGTGKTIRIFFGTVIRNEKNPSLIKRRTYQMERTLGVTEAGDTQVEYLTGSVTNQYTLNIPNSDKLTADLTFIALDSEQRDGTVSEPRKLGTVVPAAGEDAINTSSDLFRFKIAVHDDTTSAPTALFGFASEASIAIDNGVQPLKALGLLGAFDTSTGNFSVTGSVTAYFSSVNAVKAVRNNADVGVSAIFASRNSGQIYDIPLVSLGNGRVQVEMDQPIMLPLDSNGAENKNGYTMLYNHFTYLPNSAMPEN